MPNWCSTTILITRPKEDGGVKPLYDLINKWKKEGTEIGNDWDNSWLGLLVEKGLNADPINGPYSCRGCFYEVNISPEEDELTLLTETAWVPMLKMWIDLVNKYLPGANFVYSAEECGNAIYQTNDPIYAGQYVIDSWCDEVDSNWDADGDAVIDAVKRVTGIDFNQISITQDTQEKADLAIMFLEELPFDSNISITPWDYDEDLSQAS